jgi:Dienelactone hydrolase family
LSLAFRLLGTTGMRRSERLGLCRGDVDWGRGAPSVVRSLGLVDGERVTSPGKTRTSRRLVWLDTVIRDHLHSHCQRALATGAAGDGAHDRARQGDARPHCCRSVDPRRGLTRDTPDSPHLDLGGVLAEVYFAWCDNDPTAPVDTIPVITAALDAAGVVHTVDFLTDAAHGFAPAGPRYDRAASELHWERVHSLLRRKL